MAIAHVTFPTRDLDRTVAFFEKALGWRRIDRPGNIGVPAAWLQIAPGQEAHVVQIDGFQVSPFEREYGRHVAVAFPAASFPLLKERLAEQGAELIDPIRPTPFARFFFRDPNGYVFEVVAEERTPEA